MNSRIQKKIRTLLFLYLLILIVSVSGCKSRKAAARVKPANDIISLVDNFENSQSEYQWLRARSRMMYQDGSNQYTANAFIKMRQDSLIWSSVSLLIEIARAQITNDSATFLLRTSREYESYPVSDLQRMIAIQGLDLKAVQRLLVAYPPFGLNDTYTFEKKEDAYLLSKTSPSYQENIEMDLLTLRMRQYEYKRSETQRVIVKYSDFEKVENMQLPRKIEMEMHMPGKILVTFEITNYQLLSFDEVSFSIPENYKKVR